jgi:hypothetical protein
MNDGVRARPVSDLVPIQSFVVDQADIGIPWDAVYKFILRHCVGKRKADNGIMKRQKQFVDIGYCGGQGYTTGGEDIVIPCPSELNHTRSEFGQELLGILTEVLQSHCPTLVPRNTHIDDHIVVPYREKKTIW